MNSVVRLKPSYTILVIVLLIFTLSFTQIYPPSYGEVITLAALTAIGGIELLAAVLVVAGVVFIAYQAHEIFVELWYAQATQEEIQAIYDILVNGLVDGFYEITDYAWESIKSFVSDYFSSEATEIKINAKVTEADHLIITTDQSDIYALPDNFYIGSDYYEIKTVKYSTYTTTVVKKNGVQQGMSSTVKNLDGETVPFYWYVYQPSENESYRLMNYYVPYSGTEYKHTSISSSFLPRDTATRDLSGTYEMVLNPPATDWEGEGEVKKEIPVPPALDEWGSGLDGAAVLSGKYAAAVAPETDLSVPAVAAIDLSPLAIDRSLIEVFPFCIPWDFKKSIESLEAPPTPPKFEVDFSSLPGGGVMVLDFTMFEAWANIVRWGVLITFNVSLILMSRRLIGEK